MAPVFSKEAIFSGEVDYLCLVCEGYFTNELQVREHISEVGHRSKLKGTEYVEKYKGDCIRKVKKWYFCELCNVLLTTINVGLHVVDPKHKSNVTKIIKRDGGLVTISGSVAINEEAWHGISGNSCTLCNIDYDDKQTHKAEIDHIVNLIQSEVTSLDNIVYRKVFDAFHCLTCNEAIAEVDEHVSDTKHVELFRKSQCITAIKQEDKSDKTNPMNDMQYVENVNFTIESAIQNNVELLEQGFNANATLCEGDDKNNDDILHSIQEFQKNHININFETCTATCKQCSTELEFNFKQIKQHITKHKESMSKNIAANKTARPLIKDKNNEKRDSKLLFSTPVHLKNKTENSKECLITKPKNLLKDGPNEKQKPLKDSKNFNCDLDSNLKEVKNSIENGCQQTQKHIQQRETQCSNAIVKSLMKGSLGNTPNLQKVPALYMVQEVTWACGAIMNTDCIINKQYCINFFSFVFCSTIGPGLLMCNICKEVQTNDNLMVHIAAENHVRCLQEVPVIIHPDREFIREIRTDNFHCGFCNIIEPSWQEMENHLKSTSHKETKNASFWRLEIHLQGMKKLKLPQTIENSFGQAFKKLNLFNLK